MPADYRIDKQEGVVYATVWGKLTTADVMAARDRVRADPDFFPDMKQLIDGRGLTDWEPTSDETSRLADHDPFGPGARRAFVASEDVFYGMFRMYQMLTESSDIRVGVFRDMEKACEWLGISYSGS
jgi:hypothetical protein